MTETAGYRFFYYLHFIKIPSHVYRKSISLFPVPILRIHKTILLSVTALHTASADESKGGLTCIYCASADVSTDCKAGVGELAQLVGELAQLVGEMRVSLVPRLNESRHRRDDILRFC